jgi:hypothetical protein
MMKLCMSILFYALMGQTGVISKPTVVTVRLVYLDTGKPADGQEIKLFEGKPSLASTTRTTQTTDSEGIAKFVVSEPPPRSVWVDDNNGRIRSCAWEDQISLPEIFSEGVTIGKDNRFGSSCKGGQDTIARLGAKPGEIVIFVRKVGNWDNLRHY